MNGVKNAIELHGSVWITIDGENLGGSGRIALLAKIAEVGSITKAAGALKMSYKAAWDAIDAMNNLAGEPLVRRLVGGKDGGGTQLTPRGEKLVLNFQLIEEEHRKFIDQMSRQSDGITDDFLLLRRMSMKTSARNQLLGTVSAIKKGAVNDEVELEIAHGRKIVATITHESAENLALQRGTKVFALIKASSVIVVTDDSGAKFSARNCLSGTVSRIQPGAVNTEVVISLKEGGSIAAMITNESHENLKLKEGSSATAIFKASSVILGTPA